MRAASQAFPQAFPNLGCFGPSFSKESFGRFVGFQGVASLPNRKYGLSKSFVAPAPFRPPSSRPRTTFGRLAPCGFEEGRRLAWLQALRTIPRQRARPTFPAATGADFSFASSDFKALGAFFCNFCNLVILLRRARSAARPLTTSCGFAASGTIPFPGANSIFSTSCGAISGQPVFAVRPSRAAIPAAKTPLFNTDDRPGDLRRDGAVRTNIERLRNSGKKFVERHDQGHGMCSGGRPLNLVASHQKGIIAECSR